MSSYRVIGQTVANRRRDRRIVMPPIHLELDGETYRTVDWSLGGFRVAPYAGALRPGAIVDVTIRIVVNDRERRHPTEAEVLRVLRAERTLAGRFVRLDGAALDSLESLILARMRPVAV